MTGRDTDALATAVKSLSGGVRYTFHLVAHDHAFLHALTMQIAADGDSLRRSGIAFGGWGPNVKTGLVTVRVVAPSAGQIAALAATVCLPVAAVSDGYVRVVEGLLQDRYGAAVTVAPAFGERAVAF